MDDSLASVQVVTTIVGQEGFDTNTGLAISATPTNDGLGPLVSTHEVSEFSGVAEESGSVGGFLGAQVLSGHSVGKSLGGQ